MSAEQWRAIPGFPDYQVSSLGRVISRRRWHGSTAPRELRGSNNGSNYRTVRMSATDGTTSYRYVHHLVAEAFHGPRPAGMEIRHLDGNSLNNAAENLRYGTASENMYDTVRHGTNAWLSEERCRNGHERTPENTRYLPKQRLCRICVNNWEAARRERRRAAARSAA